MQRLDHAHLTQLLLDAGAISDLECLSDMVREASTGWQAGSSYQHLTKAFCDGYEFQIGRL